LPQTQIFLLTSILFSLFLACSEGDKNAGGSTEVENEVAITNKTIVGVSQKGPFINGSTVTLYELNFETQAQTGKSFIGQIEDDHGSFSISKIELTSQYALLNANGFYRNEISGNISPTYQTNVSDYPSAPNHRGLCPEGFHVPTLDEWNELIRYAEENGNGDSAAVSLRSTKTWEPSNIAPLGTDLFGFSAVATGALYGYNGYSEVEGQNTMF
jgi:uncharacterized protein (TIGR02145 family)